MHNVVIRPFRKLVHKCYDWIIKLSAHKQAMYFLFVLSFIDSSFFPIPPYVMVVPMVLATPKKAWKIAGIATISSVLGGYFGYMIGFFAFDMLAKPLIEIYGYTESFANFKNYYQEYGAWIVFIFGATPFPYKVVTITSGVMHLDLLAFGLASTLSRGARFFLIAWLLKKYGDPIKHFIDKHLGSVSILFTIILIGGIVSMKYL